jgi:hypothetical protein
MTEMGERRKEESRKDKPVRSAWLKTMFISISGARQTMDKAIVTPAAASKQKSRNAQTLNNALETILFE